MLSLPLHSSHKTQPLDRAFFKPLKSYYDAAIDNWMTSHAGQTVTLYDVAGLFKTAFERAATIEKATNGFRSTGIYPFDRNIFTDDDFLPSEVTEQDQHEEDIDPNDDNERFIDFDVDNPSDQNLPSAMDYQEADRERPSTVDSEEDPTAMDIQEADREQPSTMEDTSEMIENVPSAANQNKSPADILPLPKIKITRKGTED